MTAPAASPEVTTAAMSRRAARLAAAEAAARAEAESAGSVPAESVPAESVPAESAPVTEIAAPSPSVAASTVTAPRPHAQKGGRRAASSFSDSIEKPAGGRRARVSTPTTAEAPASDPVVVVPATDATSPDSALDSLAVVPTAETPAPESVAVVADAPVAVVPKSVSRRSLRTASIAPDAASRTGAAAASTGGPTAASSSPDTTAQGASGPGTGAPAGKGGRRSRRGDIAKGTFSVVAMLFAAGIAVATTMPASAFHAASAGAPETVLADVAPLAARQELTTSSGSAGASILRDDYSVRDVAALKAAGLRVADTFTNNPTSAVQWPFPVGVPISDGFGPRESPGGIGSTDHKGVDFTPGQGSEIHVVADGVVSKVVRSDGGGLGVYVIVDHVVDGDEVSSVYGHMLTGSIEVETGQVLKVGQVIGRVGNTGTSTGAHLHLEIRLNGTTAVDPYAWLSERVA